ncbi:hypothetical protein [Caulobacter sp. NIBR1757]|uniref:hypothetical protein n=1 Tax=Caulobacter sp. NIBR1757 TaxID=3016000 RepID=UPI0022F05426|nr:hypothetical protein [Caulobacter sp. NIBR1757]WGM40298.1 hypothetical protein AMEJIAPC_03242 [Caulobacter sp. NIBR1757]
MVFQAIGACALMRLMRADRREVESDWLLFGPTDSEVVENADEAPPFLLAAE